MKQIFEWLTSKLAPMAPLFKAKLEFEADPAAEILFADPRLVRQAVLNVVRNAIKFTPSGTIRVRSFIDGDDFVISVSDTGIGMRPEEIPLALTPFRQIEETMTRKYEGAGLGLPLAQKFVELHGGSIEIRSQPGVGTTVTLRFPPERQHPPPILRPPGPSGLALPDAHRLEPSREE
jgi:two-component system cell cycle sensor histidine kinase PleC